MKLVKQLWHSLTNLSKTDHYPLIVMHSNKQILIEQIEELLSFSTKKIAIRGDLGIIEVHGENLYILLMHQDEIMLHGTITEIQFFPEKREDI